MHAGGWERCTRPDPSAARLLRAQTRTQQACTPGCSAALLLCHAQVPARLAVLSRLWPTIALLQSPTDRLTAFAHAWRTALDLALTATAAAAAGVQQLCARCCHNASSCRRCVCATCLAALLHVLALRPWRIRPRISPCRAATACTTHVPGEPGASAAATLTSILADPFLEDVLDERPAVGGGGQLSAQTSMAGAGGGAASAAGGAGAGAGGLSAADALGVGAGPGGENVVMPGAQQQDVALPQAAMSTAAAAARASASAAGHSLAPHLPAGVVGSRAGGSRKLLSSARGVLSSGAALASNVGGALAAAASSGLGAISLPRYLDAPPPPR